MVNQAIMMCMIINMIKMFSSNPVLMHVFINVTLVTCNVILQYSFCLSKIMFFLTYTTKTNRVFCSCEVSHGLKRFLLIIKITHIQQRSTVRLMLNMWIWKLEFGLPCVTTNAFIRNKFQIIIIFFFLLMHWWRNTIKTINNASTQRSLNCRRAEERAETTRAKITLMHSLKGYFPWKSIFCHHLSS